MRRRARECERRRQDELERDEARIDDEEVGALGEPRRIEGANVGRFHGYDLRSPAQPWMQLAAPDIHGIDASRAACNKTPGKPAGRGAATEEAAAARTKKGFKRKGMKRGRNINPPRHNKGGARTGRQDATGA